MDHGLVSGAEVVFAESWPTVSEFPGEVVVTIDRFDVFELLDESLDPGASDFEVFLFSSREEEEEADAFEVGAGLIAFFDEVVGKSADDFVRFFAVERPGFAVFSESWDLHHDGLGRPFDLECEFSVRAFDFRNDVTKP